MILFVANAVGAVDHGPGQMVLTRFQIEFFNGLRFEPF